MNKSREPFSPGLSVFVLSLLLTLEARAQSPTPPKPLPGEATILRSRDGQSVLRLDMSLQTDLRLAALGPDFTSSFLVRRARLGLTGSVNAFVDARLIADFGQTDTPLFQDAWIDVRATPWLRLRAGRLKVPFGHEWLETSSTFVDFIEPSLVYTLVMPRYDQGLALHGDLSALRTEYWLGFFNEASGKVLDADTGKMVAGRVSVEPVAGLSLAVSGTHALGDNQPEALRGKLATGQSFLPTSFSSYVLKNADGTSGLYALPPEWRLGTELVSYLGPASLKVEYARAWSPSGEDKRGHLPMLDTQAVYASTTLVLTGEPRTNRGVKPLQPFDPASGQYGPGAWEFGLRGGFARTRLDASAEAHVQELTAGLNWYLNGSTKWMVDYSHYRLGQDPSSLNELLMRLQWAF